MCDNFFDPQDSSPQVGFVHLARTFRVLEGRQLEERADADIRKNAAIENYLASTGGLHSGLSWQELLEEPLAVVLGEPGSGKTWEFREQARLMRASGQDAFFIPLEALIQGTVSGVLSPQDQQRYANWFESRRRASFFLDSVDESKFTRTDDFKRALDHLRHSLGDLGASRIQLILSSRISEWSPATDAGLVSTSFPLLVPRPIKSERKVTSLRIVQIDPLGPKQVLSFAQAKDLENPETFVEALDEALAWDFARRPYDVIGLINFWQRTRRVGSPGEIVGQIISDELKETQNRRANDPLTEEQATKGAETLAAADILCRELNIRIPDDAHISDAPGLDSTEALPSNWTAREKSALLSRAIFDSACYGRIRFHHRRIVEYLCAGWFERLLANGLTSFAVEQIFLTHTPIGPVVRPSLAPVAAWLAIGESLWNERIRSLLAAHAPEVFLRYGDATRLKPDYKKEIILALLENHRKRTKQWTPTEREAVRLLADPSLATFINERLADPAATFEMKDFLLGLVRDGRLTGCGDQVLTMIADPTSTEDIRHDGVLALRQCGSSEQRRRLVEVVTAQSSVAPELCARVCETSFPAQMSAVELRRLLEKVEHAGNRTVNLPHYLSNLFQKKLPPSQSHEVLVELLQLARTEPITPDEYGHEPISQRYRWLRKVLPTVVLSMLEIDNLNSSEMRSVSAALDLIGTQLRDFSIDRGFAEKLTVKLAKHVALRRFYFWHHVGNLRSRSSAVSVHTLFGYNSQLQLKDGDWTWWLADFAREMNEVDASLAFDCAFQLFYSRGQSLADGIELYHAVKHRTDLRRRFLSSVKFIARSKAVGIWRRSKIPNLFDFHWRTRRKLELSDHYFEFKGKLLLRRNLPLLSSGKQWQWLFGLLGEAHESSKWGVTNWDEIRKKYGKRIAVAAEQGCKAAWRNHRPELPHEKQKPNEVAVGVVVGLSGLNSELGESTTAVANLSAAEAELATRYATNEINGFSAWLRLLAARYPEVVGAVLSDCVRHEWSTPADRENTHEVVSSLIYHGDGLRPLARAALKESLETRDPVNLTILRQVLKLFTLEDLEDVGLIRRLAPQRIAAYQVTSPQFSLWMSVWLQTDAPAALDELERILPTHPNPSDGMVAICAHLQQDRRDDAPHLPSPDYGRAEPLARFIGLVFRSIRIAEDIQHEGSYSPTARDEAGRFRDGLVGRLAACEEPVAASLLLQLRDNPDLRLANAWITSLYERCLVNRSEATPWRESDVRDFEETHERNPRSDQDLFDITIARLRDIENEVERSDNSPRAELNQNHSEADFRRWITRRLRSNARGRYTAPEESEVDWERYPDIRIENPQTNPVSIEMKWADKWTLSQLIQGLEQQLIGRYLRAETSRFGIYLLGYIGRKQTWEGESGESLSFTDVVENLRARAQALVEAQAGQLDLRVISIDFLPPPRG